jgi:hypothetical protein
MLEGRIVVTGVILAIFITAVAIALVYFPAGTKLLPLTIGIPGIILTAIQLYAELQNKDPKVIEPEIRRGEIVMVIWFAVFAAVIVALGFIYGAPLMIAAYLLFAAKEKWYTALIGAVLAFVLLDYIFQEFIGVILWEGIIPPMLMGY